MLTTNEMAKEAAECEEGGNGVPFVHDDNSSLISRSNLGNWTCSPLEILAVVISKR